MTKILLAFAMVIVGIYVSAQSNQIDSTGNVGIGTTNPNTPLEVIGKTTLHGVVAIDSSVVIGDSLVIERDTKVKEDLRVDGKGIFEKKLRTKKSLVVDKDARIKRDIIMEDYAQDIQDYGIMFLDEDGKTYPVTKSLFKNLLVELGYEPTSCLQDPNGNTIFVTPTWHNQNPHTVYTGVGNCERNAIVGVNTAYPEAAMHIINETSLADNLLVLERDNSQIPTQEMVKINNNGHLHINAYQNPSDPFDNNYLMVTDVASGKKFLQLDKNGLLRAREIKVDPFVWPDYVFEEDYVLMPLSEVEQFIKKNGHLPNVKSAKEIEKEGINLGETDRMLMEKIEEMTLYMIQLEKKVKELESKLNEQKK